MNGPLVSVMMPCYNAARSLPLALASLVAQTYSNWECLLVDDGSTDGSHDVAGRLVDPRVKLIRLPCNRGRGAARQVAVDSASGDLLSMLDADDWLYPDKLERQVEIMIRERDVALVGAGLGIVDANNDLMGVRCQGPVGPICVLGPVVRLASPPVAFGSSMLRMHLSRAVRFDPLMFATEDQDFLTPYLLGRRYAVLPDVSYAYFESTGVTLKKVVNDLRLVRRSFAKHRDVFPFGGRWNEVKLAAKEATYRCAFGLGLGKRMVTRRSRPPSPDDLRRFLGARQEVDTVASRLFGNTAFIHNEKLAPAAGRY